MAPLMATWTTRSAEWGEGRSCDLGRTGQGAILHETAMRRGRENARQFGDAQKIPGISYHTLDLPVSRMLDWPVRHDPTVTAQFIDLTVEDAQDPYDIPLPVAEQAIRAALADGEPDPTAQEGFLAHVFSACQRGGIRQRNRRTPETGLGEHRYSG